MTDNEIVKALDILEKHEFFGGQRAGRELWSKKPVDVQNKDVEDFAKDIAYLKDFIIRQKAEIERYKENMPYLEQQSLDFCGVLCDFAEELIAKYKSEAVKKFADRLKADLGDPFLRAHGCVEPIVNNLVKEMTEETK